MMKVGYEEEQEDNEEIPSKNPWELMLKILTNRNQK